MSDGHPQKRHRSVRPGEHEDTAPHTVHWSREESPHTSCLEGVQQSWGHTGDSNGTCTPSGTGGTRAGRGQEDTRSTSHCTPEKLTKKATASAVSIAWGCGVTSTQLWCHQDALEIWLFVLKLSLHRYLYTVHVHRTYTEQHMYIFCVFLFVHYITDYRNTENIGFRS